jgi:hypothetical protein
MISQRQRGQSRGEVGFAAGIAIGQFDDFGHHISPEELREGYKRKGLCGFCGKVKTHNRVFGIGGFAMEPLKKGSNVYEGYCTNCHTMEEIYEKPEVKQNLEAKARKGKALPRSLSKQNVNKKVHRRINSVDSSGTPSWNVSQRSLTISCGSGIDEGVETSHSPRGVDEIVVYMQSDAKSATAQAQGCANLGRLSTCPPDQLMGGIDAIIKAMALHSKNPEVVKEGCRAFRRFSAHTASSGESQGSGEDLEVHAENCAKIFDQGGLHAVMAALKLFTTNRNIQREGMRCVRNMVCAVQESKAVIAENSGTKSVVNGMWANTDSASMQEDGCIILWSLSYGDYTLQRDIMESNGVGAIINAMSSYVASEKVQYHACGALHTLSNSKEIKAIILENGGFDFTVTALKEHSYSLEIVEKAMAALVNLAVNSKDSKSSTKLCVMNQEEIGTVVNAMQQHMDARRVQKIGCYFLELASRSRSNLKILKAHKELRSLLRGAANKFPDSCANSVSCILAMMDGKNPHEV